MKKDEYLKLVEEQIRCRQAREFVREELEQHIIDQAAEFCREGLSEDEAMEKAVEEMGDPVETGVSMDSIHRPQMDWGMLVLIGVISLFSVLIQASIAMAAEGQIGGGWISFTRHVLNVGMGFLLMLAVYRLDYSFIARHTIAIAGGFLAFAAVCMLLGGTTVNGASYYIIWKGPMISAAALLLLYIPIFAGILYYYRGDNYKILGKIFIWSLIPLMLALKIPSIITALILALVFAGMFSVAAWNGWYKINGKRVVVLLWLLLLVLPTGVTGILLAGGMLAPYQMDRLSAWISGNYDYSFTADVIKEIFSGSHLLGPSSESFSMAAEKLAGFNNDHVIVSIIAVYGILAGAAVIILMTGLVIKIFHISLMQKNQLGMVMGFGCGMAFLVQVVLNIAVNFSSLPETSIVLPMFSSGLSNIVVSYILLGLVLSIYRYKHILRETSKTGNWMSRKKRRHAA